VERVPNSGVAENLTVSPATEFPLREMCAVIVETMAEPAATVGGAAESDSTPEEITTNFELDKVPQSAVIVAVPTFDPGVNVTVANPWALVGTDVEERVPKFGVAEKSTVSP